MAGATMARQRLPFRPEQPAENDDQANPSEDWWRSAIGSGFPTSHGTISPANVTISLATTCGGSATASTPATSFRTIAGSLDRLGFLVPGTLAAGNYFVALSGTTSDGTKFSSVSGSCWRLAVTHTNATLAACIQPVRWP